MSHFIGMIEIFGKTVNVINTMISVTMKGTNFWINSTKRMLPMPHTTYRIAPTGGVITPIPKFKMKIRPK